MRHIQFRISDAFESFPIVAMKDTKNDTTLEKLWYTGCMNSSLLCIECVIIFAVSHGCHSPLCAVWWKVRSRNAPLCLSVSLLVCMYEKRWYCSCMCTRCSKVFALLAFIIKGRWRVHKNIFCTIAQRSERETARCILPTLDAVSLCQTIGCITHRHHRQMSVHSRCSEKRLQ